jgi:hypothetical protein
MYIYLYIINLYSLTKKIDIYNIYINMGIKGINNKIVVTNVTGDSILTFYIPVLKVNT